MLTFLIKVVVFSVGGCTKPSDVSPFCTYCDYKNGHFIYVLSIPGPYKGD